VGADPKLTRRAIEVADLVALGLTNREIAKRLFLSDRTVEWHIEQILNKLGFSSRSQIAAWLVHRRLARRRRLRHGRAATSPHSSRASSAASASCGPC